MATGAIVADHMPESPAVSAQDQFAQRLSAALQSGQCDRITLANPSSGVEPDLQRLLARPVQLKGQLHLSIVSRFRTRDITRNLPAAEGVTHLLAQCGMSGFRNAHLHTTDGLEVQLAFSKKGKATVRVGKANVPDVPGATGATAVAHNRSKHRYIEQSRPFLHALGVTDAQGQVVPSMSRKWKQINKFVEIFASALEASAQAADRPLHVVDFGSGKGYLTFAVHDWLLHVRGLDAQVTGVELRAELVALCQGVIDRLGLQGMHYEQGDVRHYHPDTLDVVIALHACDTATDHAIFLGVRAGADIILCSPCCHKEVRPQLLSPHPLRPILRHGIHLGQEAEMLTDGLRALLLEACGYDTQVFEFVSLEHTNKNKMILAVKRKTAGDPGKIWRQIDEIKAFYGIQAQCLEQLLQEGGWRQPLDAPATAS